MPDLDEELPIAEEVDDSELWLLAPGESHVQAFRHFDGIDGARIEVQFKPTRTQPVRTYRYSFGPSERDHARVIWEEMSAATHPGIVIWEWLIRPGVQVVEI